METLYLTKGRLETGGKIKKSIETPIHAWSFLYIHNRLKPNKVFLRIFNDKFKGSRNKQRLTPPHNSSSPSLI